MQDVKINEEINKEEKKETIWDIVKFAFLALIIVIPIRAFIAQPFVVSGSSMYPTFKNGDYLIVDEISYRLNDPKRGDVIIFRYPKDPKKFYIKRVIGLPNETIEIQDGKIKIVNEENKEGFYLEEKMESFTIGEIIFKLKEGEYFVMGDNRAQSSDSRYWGALPEENIVGKAFLRLLPLNQIGIMPGKIQE